MSQVVAQEVPVVEKENEASSHLEEPEIEYPASGKVIVIMLALFLAMFLVALDRTIIATAVPRITDDFNSLGDVGWYASSYLLTACSFQLIFGRIYTFYSPKRVFLGAIIVFEIGSAICGAAPNSTAFIVGRAIAGLGSSGIFSGVIIIMTNAVPLHKRPLYQGLFGAVFGVASVTGPLIGGAFTTNATWRWCFYINLPVGAAAFLIIAFILHARTPKRAELSVRQQINKLDPLGTAFFLPSVVCLLLALQWGGSTYAWSNGRIVALLVLFVFMFAAFVAVQISKPETATVPARIFTQRSIIAGMEFSFFVGSTMMVMVYYIPLWFQAILGVDAVQSGIRSLPLVLSLVVASIFTGICVSRIGYYTPFLYLSTVFLSVGAGMLTLLRPDSGMGEWLGFQVICGFGIGMGMQQPSMAAQTVLKLDDVPTGVSLIFFAQNLGGAVLVSVAQNVFANKLVSNLSGIANFNPEVIINIGATQLRNVVPQAHLGQVIQLYNAALTDTFDVAVACACCTVVGAALMEWRSIKKSKKVTKVEAEA